MPISSSRVKLGLALSGGGFRAALFHVGVLAQMADLGLLRHVEVLSTVSGGSIMGALYYLHVKRLLESKPDDQITDDDYRALVQTIETEFLAAVQKNIRMRTFSNPLKNWRMRRPDYSRSDRLGELYDELLYRPAFTKSGAIAMRDLKIYPKGAGGRFHPRRDNAHRAAKVPILLINATSLNTGRNWRFEASRMGEPQADDRIALDIDKVTRLVRPRTYADLAPKPAAFALGRAVAASAAVPGLFPPLPLGGVYPDRGLELVDGGIHDNQGLQGLLDEGCTRFVISDASGQMEEEREPSSLSPGVLARSSSVLMTRVRSEQLRRLLESRHANSAAFVHLKRDLAPEVVSYIGRDGEVTAPTQRAGSGRRIPMHPDVQQLLSQCRTDLDAFNDAEAYALMSAGYLISQAEFQQRPAFARLGLRPKATPWRFLEIQPWLEEPTTAFLRQLEVSRHLLFKSFLLSARLRTASLCAAAAALLAWLTLGNGWEWLVTPRQTSFNWTWGFVLVAGILLVGGCFARTGPGANMLRFARKPATWVYRWVFRAALPALLSFVFLFYLAVLNPLYLAQGRLSRMGTPSPRQQRPGQPPAVTGARWGRLIVPRR